MKLCNKCGCVKEASEFYKKPTAKDSLFWWCRTCHKDYVKTKYHTLAQSDVYRQQERNRINAYNRQNPEKVRERGRLYSEKNRPKLVARAKQYVLSRERRTPAWLTLDDLRMMEQAYELAALRTKLFGFSWHVDHVLPLHGKFVSGLHVPHNLQVIPGFENRSKSNRYNVT